MTQPARRRGPPCRGSRSRSGRCARCPPRPRPIAPFNRGIDEAGHRDRRERRHVLLVGGHRVYAPRRHSHRPRVRTALRRSHVLAYAGRTWPPMTEENLIRRSNPRASMGLASPLRTTWLGGYQARCLDRPRPHRRRTRRQHIPRQTVRAERTGRRPARAQGEALLCTAACSPRRTRRGSRKPNPFRGALAEMSCGRHVPKMPFRSAPIAAFGLQSSRRASRSRSPCALAVSPPGPVALP